MYDGLRDERRWLLPEALQFQARARGNATFVTEVSDGTAFSYAAAATHADAVAGFFAALGVQPGESVAVLLRNGLDFVLVWLGLLRLGATMAALNPELRGTSLAHQIADCGCRVAVLEDAIAPEVVEFAERLPVLETLVVKGTLTESRSRFRYVSLASWRDARPWDGRMPEASNIACIMYTSGTTGPAKGVLMPHAHCFLFGLGTIDNLQLTERDHFYIALPFFHANGLFMQLGATLIAGATATIRERFSASNWIADIRRAGATVTNVLGAVSAFVLAQPPRPDDLNNTLRVIGAAPDPVQHDTALRDRFGVADVIPLYGMTEVNIPLYGEMGKARGGTCGRVYDRYFELEIRDPETDMVVPTGSVGEIMVRPKAAFGFMAGYHGKPEKTVESWRNLWFHTGDAAMMREDGYVMFVDRIKDCIRRRGQNISSFEVDASIVSHPRVAEAAAYAVPAGIEGCEDEIMVAVVLAPGAQITPQDILEHACKDLPRFAEPRFIDILPELPKTPTGKIQKAMLRKRGVVATTWDRNGVA